MLHKSHFQCRCWLAANSAMAGLYKLEETWHYVPFCSLLFLQCTQELRAQAAMNADRSSCFWGISCFWGPRTRHYDLIHSLSMSTGVFSGLSAGFGTGSKSRLHLSTRSATAWATAVLSQWLMWAPNTVLMRGQGQWNSHICKLSIRNGPVFPQWTHCMLPQTLFPRWRQRPCLRECII